MLLFFCLFVYCLNEVVAAVYFIEHVFLGGGVTDGFHSTFFRYEKRQWKKFSRMVTKGANAALVRMSSGGVMKSKQERIGVAQNATSREQGGRNRISAIQEDDEMDNAGMR